jgi:tetratricopeptide (TPR) repeat protein
VLVDASRRFPRSLAIAQELGRVRQDRDDYVGAEREYRRASELDPESPIPWQGLALALFRQKQDEEALAATRRATELAGAFDPSLANVTGALLDRMDHHEEAREIFERLVREHPENPAYVFNLAYSLDSAQRVAEAKPLYERALELQPDLPDAAVCLAWLLATAADDSLRDHERAEGVILAALELDRGRSPGLVRGAEDVAKKTGRVERTLALLEELAAEGEVDERAVRLERAKRRLEAFLDER